MSGETFGGAVRRLRRARNWTQEDLAYHAAIDQTSVSQYERDKHLPTMAMIKRLAHAFGMPPEDLARLAGHLPAEEPAPDIWERAPFDLIVAALKRLPGFTEHQQLEQAAHFTPEAQERLLRQVGRDMGNRVIDELERQAEERARAAAHDDRAGTPHRERNGGEVLAHLD